MTTEEIRLKCLELAVKLTATTAHVIETATAFEQYVAGADKPKSNTIGLPQKPIHAKAPGSTPR